MKTKNIGSNKNKLKKNFYISIAIIIILISLFLLLVYFLNYSPDEVEKMKYTNLENNNKTFSIGDEIKILCWNIQYMAGKDYVFFYDLLDGSGPDEKPSKDAISKTIIEVVRIINEEKPDIILLQEVDDGSKRTYYEDQLKRLLNLISKEYKSHSSAFYHKSNFVPHPRIMGAVGMKLSTISKYKIKSSIRHQLQLKPDNWIKRQFDLKRAVLETRFEIKDSKDLIIYNTHLSAFSQGTDTLQKQVEEIKDLLKTATDANCQWIIGGDFNLLPNKKSYNNLKEYEQKYYNENTELILLTKKYKSVPSLENAELLDPKWFTHFPNNPAIKKPDRIIDYIFYSDNIRLIESNIRQKDTMKISDHFPIIIKVKI